MGAQERSHGRRVSPLLGELLASLDKHAATDTCQNGAIVSNQTEPSRIGDQFILDPAMFPEGIHPERYGKGPKKRAPQPDSRDEPVIRSSRTGKKRKSSF